MAVNKRGMFFTILAMLLMGLFLLSFVLTTGRTYREEALVEGTRLEAMHNFVNDFERDIDRVLYITGFRAILAVEEYVINNGSFIQQPQTVILEALMSGTINNVTTLLMSNATFSQWLAKVEERAELMDITVATEIININALQRDAWHIDIDLNVSLNISDRKGSSGWVKEHQTTAHVLIEGFEDPFYVLFSYGLLTNIIIKANTTDFVDEATNDTTNLQIHLNNSHYIESSDAPSFLMRLSGNFSSSPYGIESLVNLNEFKEQGIGLRERSSVDYIYFSDIVHNTNRIQGISDTSKWSWFLLDDNSLDTYECTGIEIP